MLVKGEEQRTQKPKPGGVRSARQGARPSHRLVPPRGDQPANPGMPRGRAAYQRPGLGRSFHVREHAQRESAGEGTTLRGLRRSHPARLGRPAGHGCRLPRNPMALEGLAGELAAVLEGRGLCVQNCDSEPPGEPPAPVRLRRNVCYVVLAVCLNEQVSVRPPAPCPGHGARSQPRGDRGPSQQQPSRLCGWRFLVLQSTCTYTDI